MLEVKLSKRNETALEPVYATDGSGCFDLYSTDDAVIHPGQAKDVGTGLSFEIPEGHVMLVFSRSGHGFKSGVRLSNSVGVIDSDYRGEVRVKLHNDGASLDFRVQAGDRVAQAMIVPIPKVKFTFTDKLTDTQRGEGGLGSTGAT